MVENYGHQGKLYNFELKNSSDKTTKVHVYKTKIIKLRLNLFLISNITNSDLLSCSFNKKFLLSFNFFYHYKVVRKRLFLNKSVPLQIKQCEILFKNLYKFFLYTKG